MRITNLKIDNKVYTSNVYLIRGDNNSMSDLNTLVDVGRDERIIDKINRASTGVAKKRIAQVALTHSHYDHSSLLHEIKYKYDPVVFAWSKSIDGVTQHIYDWDTLQFGDRSFEVIYIPGHSNDSVCYYCEEDGVIFCGDTQLINIPEDSTFTDDFIKKLERINNKKINVIYPGHGEPIDNNCNKKIQQSIDNLKRKTMVEN